MVADSEDLALFGKENWGVNNTLDEFQPSGIEHI